MNQPSTTNHQYYGDYHTHTKYSHGKGSVEANIKAAHDLGLKEIAVTDHGFRHPAYGVRRRDFARMRDEVRAAAEKCPQITVYLGLETNLQGLDGKIDINLSDLDCLDILLCGFHKMVQPPSAKEFFSFFVPNFFTPAANKTRLKNTKAYVNAIERYPIDIITHLRYGMNADVYEIALAAKAHGTVIELNGKRVSMTDAEVARVIESGVGIIVNSDGHSPSAVGNFSVPQTVIERVGIPAEQIVNLGKRPDFRLKNWKEEIRVLG